MKEYTSSSGGKPDGAYAQDMTGPGAWPESDESLFENRARVLGDKLSQLNGALDSWSRNKAQIFNGPNVWTGPSSNAASSHAEKHSAAMRELQQGFRDAIAWNKDAAGHIKETKQLVVINVRAGQREIRDVVDDAKDGDDVEGKIDGIVSRRYDENKAIVSNRALSVGRGTAETPATPLDERNDGDEIQPAKTKREEDEIPSTLNAFTHSGKHSREGGDDYRNDNQRQPVIIPAGNRKAATEGDLSNYRAQDEYSEPAVTPVVNQKGGRDGNVSDYQSPRGADGRTVPNGKPSLTPPTGPVRADAPVGSSPPASSPNSPGGPGGATVVTGGTGGTSGGAGAPGAPGGLGGGPTDGAGRADNGSGKMDPTKMAGPTQPPGGSPNGVQPPASPLNQMAHGLANAGPPIQPSSVPIAPSTPIPDVAAGTPGAPGAPGASGGNAPGGGWGGASAPVSSSPSGGGMSMGGGMPPPMPLGPPPTPAPAAPSGGSSGGSGSAPSQPGSASVHPASANSSTNSAAVAAAAGVAPMPVSAARLERDAIVAATSGGSSQGKNNDALTVARRIAAALNAIQVVDFGFYWMTAVAADGTIVVANSYGIGYIPEGVNLPVQVKFANADESIPVADRAKWVTYPLLMLQGWAQHHDVALRQVIATEEQFKGFDPGVTKVVLQPDDIPASGTMQGRSRLEVIAPHAAVRLATTSDFNLSELLPPAPTDPTAPTEDRFMKWFSVMQCLMTEMDGRMHAHLTAFVEYANYAQLQALHTAHTATDAAVQRAAIADWVYWQHLGVLMSDALSADVTV